MIVALSIFLASKINASSVIFRNKKKQTTLVTQGEEEDVLV